MFDYLRDAYTNYAALEGLRVSNIHTGDPHVHVLFVSGRYAYGLLRGEQGQHVFCYRVRSDTHRAEVAVNVEPLLDAKAVDLSRLTIKELSRKGPTREGGVIYECQGTSSSFKILMNGSDIRNHAELASRIVYSREQTGRDGRKSHTREKPLRTYRVEEGTIKQESCDFQCTIDDFLKGTNPFVLARLELVFE